MGVHDLWKVLEPTARPVLLESLRGKVLAIDASIWIYQFLKAMRDASGQALRAGHVIGFFRRICKLLFYEIKPVFVFDGAAPLIKKLTTERRKHRAVRRAHSAKATANKLLTLQLQRMHNANTSSKPNKERPLVKGKITSTNAKPKFVPQDQFDLHPLEKIEPVRMNDQRLLSEKELDDYAKEFSESARSTGFVDTDSIDFESPEFKAMPIQSQYQLLNTARLKSRLRMGYTPSQLGQMFPDPDTFSKFQIDRVSQRNFFTQKLMNLVGFEDDLTTRRVSSEKGKEYMIQKGNGGWSLSLGTHGSPAVEPKKETEEEIKEHFESEDDFEDVDLEPKLKDEEQEQEQEKEQEQEVELPLWFKSAASGETPAVQHANAEDDILFGNSQSRGTLLDKLRQRKSPGRTGSESPNLQQQANTHDIRIEPDREAPVPEPFSIDVSVSEARAELPSSPIPRPAIDLLEEPESPEQAIPGPPNVLVEGAHLDLVNKPAQAISPVKEIEILREAALPESSTSQSGLAVPNIEPAKEASPSTSVEPITHTEPQAPEPSERPSPERGDPVSVNKHALEPAQSPPSKQARTSSPSPTPELEEIEISEAEKQLADQDALVEEQQEEEIAHTMIEELEENERFLQTLNKNVQRGSISAEIDRLKNLHAQQQRDADNVTQEMVNECMELLQLFGIPYVTAPGEAEAQCAELYSLGLVDGVVTDDGDCFLFGDVRVYRNMFNQSKYVELYESVKIEAELGLSRGKLISMAFLLGSDYVDGIVGVGPVTSVELLAEFPDLARFREWWESAQRNQAEADSTFKRKFSKKFASKLFLPEEFPNPAVIEAYEHPNVDSDPTAFTWGAIDVEQVRNYMHLVAGWSHETINKLIVPVAEESKRRELLKKGQGQQSTLDDFAKVNNQFKSKRASAATSKLRNASSS